MPEDDEEEEDGEPRAGKVNCRGDLNILLCGDPGTRCVHIHNNNETDRQGQWVLGGSGYKSPS